MTAQQQRGAPLLGFLVAESDAEIRVRVPSGTWVIERADVVSLEDWDGPVQAPFDGRPVQVETRSGATIGLLQHITIDATDRPMTLGGAVSALVGADRLEELAQDWGGRYALSDDPVTVGASPTVCWWDDPSGFGMVVQTDDCKD